MPVLGPSVTPNLGPAPGVIRRWPANHSLAVLTAGGGRWTMLCEPGPAEAVRTPSDLDAALARRPTGEAEPLDDPETSEPPFRSGWAVALSYGLGSALEPGQFRPAAGPLGDVLPIRGVLAHDSRRGVWHGAAPPPAGLPNGGAAGAGFRVGMLTSDLGRARYESIVRRGLDAIASGDVYQVNLAHRLSAPFEGSTRAFFAALLERTGAVHGAYLELPGEHGPTAICSASPELFLRVDAGSRRVTTRPMKGTRPISCDPEELRTSEKDRAELNMITDLMRNDLGRVCAFGSVQVEAARTIEAHASSVWQATSTVSGKLRDYVTNAELIRATFPPGSVTGAPKIRAMQLIEELEPSGRGFYCGSVGWIDNATSSIELNVAIRTAQIVTLADGSRELRYHAGAGIVADSEPWAEWAETLSKAGVLGSSMTV